MKKLLLVAVILTCAAAAQADLLIGFNFNGYLGNEGQGTSTVFAANMQNPAYITCGTGLAPTSNGNSFRALNWASADLATAISANDYFSWTISADSGFSANATGLVFNWSYSGTGPSTMTLRSSADSFASDLATYSSVVNGATQTTALAVSGSSIEFRLYAYGNTATGGTAGFDASAAAGSGILEVYGTAVAVPEPVTLAFVGIGAALFAILRQRKNV